MALLRYNSILVRATNWVGDAVMSLPALRAIRDAFPGARIAIVAKPFVADLYEREGFEIIPYRAKTLPDKLRFAWGLRARRFDCAILLQNAFEAALIARVAGIRERIGYDRDGRGWLLTRAIPRPKKGEIPVHERFYYLELLRRAGIIEALPESNEIRLGGNLKKRTLLRVLVGVSPGAAFGSAKRWLPERFAEAAVRVAKERGAAIAIFGTKDEAALCQQVAGMIEGVEVTNYAGRTTLREFIDLAAECAVFLTNDSGSMHIASALGVATVAVFGATDHVGTGPTGRLASVVREPVDCAPCHLRECPIDHRCMTGVGAERVANEALRLLRIEG